MRTHDYSRESALWAHSTLERAYYEAQAAEIDIKAVEMAQKENERLHKICLITDIGKAMKNLGYIMSVKQFDKYYGWNVTQLGRHLLELSNLIKRKYGYDKL